jgi:hypothetical protein
VSYDSSPDSTDVASLDTNGNPIQDQLSSANRVQSLPLGTAAACSHGAEPTQRARPTPRGLSAAITRSDIITPARSTTRSERRPTAYA